MEQRLTEEQIKNLSKRIKNVSIGAIIFGILQASHFIIAYLGGKLTLTQGIGFSLIVLFFCFKWNYNTQ